jgi:hypothetical protein
VAVVKIFGKAIKNVRKWDVDIFADDKETDEEYFEKITREKVLNSADEFGCRGGTPTIRGVYTPLFVVTHASYWHRENSLSNYPYWNDVF